MFLWFYWLFVVLGGFSGFTGSARRIQMARGAILSPRPILTLAASPEFFVDFDVRFCFGSGRLQF